MQISQVNTKFKLLALSSLLLVAGCSSTIELKEPPMTPIESEFKLVQSWKVFQGSLDQHDAEALVFANNGQTFFVANNNGVVSAISAQNQSRWQDQIIWQAKFADRIISGPVLDSDELIVGSDKGRVRLLNAQTGQVIWQTQVSSEVLSAATVDQGKVYVRTSDGKVYALNRTSGEVVWTSEHQMPSLSFRGSPKIIASDNLVFVAWESGMVQALLAQSGELVWESRVAIPSGRTDLERMVDIQANLVLKDQTLYALGYHGKFVAINIDTGNFLFVKELSGYRDFIVADQVVYVVDEQDVIQALDRFTGTALWKQNSMKGRGLNDLHLHQENLVVADYWGYIHWFNAVQGTEFARVKHSNEYGDGNRISQMSVEEDVLLVVDETGELTRYQIDKSNLLQFREEIAKQTGEPIEALNQGTSQDNAEQTAEPEKASGDSWFSFSKWWPF